MNDKNSDKLIKTCPTLYRYREESPTLVNRWGFECGNGWFDIIYELSIKLESISNELQGSGISEKELLIASQVKEKLGYLHFYVEGNISQEVPELIREAALTSAKTCYFCGAKAEIASHDGWLAPICPSCEQ